jgi:hypothetical protein
MQGFDHIRTYFHLSKTGPAIPRYISSGYGHVKDSHGLVSTDNPPPWTYRHIQPPSSPGPSSQKTPEQVRTCHSPSPLSDSGLPSKASHEKVWAHSLPAQTAPEQARTHSLPVQTTPEQVRPRRSTWTAPEQDRTCCLQSAPEKDRTYRVPLSKAGLAVCRLPLSKTGPVECRVPWSRIRPVVCRVLLSRTGLAVCRLPLSTPAMLLLRITPEQVRTCCLQITPEQLRSCRCLLDFPIKRLDFLILDRMNLR